jgi:MFS family permease
MQACCGLLALTEYRARVSSTTASGALLRPVLALGITQITAWGTSYYCLGVLAGPISADTGWDRSLVFLGFTVALLVMGTISAWAGRAIDRHGARAVMCAGTLIVSAGLLALSRVGDAASYLVVWAVLGVGMRLCLYDAAFAALVQVIPARGRQAISYLTLFGAFASSVFWVIGHELESVVGWRDTLAWFALINLLVCLPLNWYGLSRRDVSPAAEGAPAAASTLSPDGPPLAGRMRRIGMVLFAVTMSLNGFVFGVVSVQLVPLLEAAGLTTATAVWVASTKGFAQFAGRVIEIVFARNVRALSVARISLGVLPVSLVLLLLAAGDFAALLVFTLLMGGSQGVITIVRGAVPLALFGSQGYGTVLGLIATPILIVNAAAPTLFALLIGWIGWAGAEIALLICATSAWLLMEVMSRWFERTRREAAG